MLRFFSFITLTFFLVLSASADTVETVMMPGKVIQGHAKWENDCQQCHKPFNKVGQSQLCKDCHKEIAKDAAQKQGFHGRLKDGRNCSECHTEHKGRGAQTAPIVESTFKHAQTDFELKGAHAEAKVACKECHKPMVKYRDTPNTCNACHKKDDKHEGSLGTTCANCHIEKSWKDTQQFDHNKSRFSLEGKHINVKCVDCHLSKKYRETTKDCFSCHKKDDKHKSAFGTKCADCHTAKDWAATTFNHDKDTKFSLRGKHQSVKCDSCHKSPLGKVKLETNCVACHRTDDKHEGKLGNRCENCHSETSWFSTPGFNHDKDTKFSLRGKHKTAKCQSCHKNGVNEKLPLLCNECHRMDDKHKGNFGIKCDGCHTEGDWKSASKFIHDRDTKFVLLDKHKAVKCDACHKGNLYQDKLKSTCIACHIKDDKHKGQQGDHCEDCHNAQSWTKTKFDHSKSEFPLLGKHSTVDCKKCHLTPAFKDAKMECVTCHTKDDVHKRRLGIRCETCHNARDWRVWDFDHDQRTTFKLTGGHKGIDCYACHKSPATGKKFATPTACVDCHTKDDVHDGGFGRQCDRCHVSTTFKELKMGLGVSK